MINIVSYFKELVQEFNLVSIFIQRDLKVKYSQTLLGILWAIIRPMATLIIFIFMFKKIANINEINGVPVQLIILSGIIFWNYFANGFNNVANSILANTNLVTKVYFPRIILGIASLAVPFIDFILGLIIYIIISIYFGFPIGFLFLGIPTILLFLSLMSLGLGLFFASNSIKYRDLQHVSPLIVQYGFFLTPVVYSIQSVKFEDYISYFYALNPLVGIIELGRYFLIPNYTIHFNLILISLIVTLLLFIIGVIIFIKKEKTLVDHI